MKAQFVPTQSLVKLLIYFRDGRKPQMYYSLINDDKKGAEWSLQRMHYRLLAKKFKNQFSTAIFYDNISGVQLAKYGFFGDRIN